MPRSPAARHDRASVVTTCIEPEALARGFAGGHLGLLPPVGANGLTGSRPARETPGGRACRIEGRAPPPASIESWSATTRSGNPDEERTHEASTEAQVPVIPGSTAAVASFARLR